MILPDANASDREWAPYLAAQSEARGAVRLAHLWRAYAETLR